MEARIARSLREADADFEYETLSIPYTRPAQVTRYRPDFILTAQAIIIEGKGEFTSADRRKMRLIKEQYPDLDIRFVFSNPQSRIGKKSETTYAMWCDRYGFPYARVQVPEEWLKHKPKAAQSKALKELLNGT